VSREGGVKGFFLLGTRKESGSCNRCQKVRKGGPGDSTRPQVWSMNDPECFTKKKFKNLGEADEGRRKGAKISRRREFRARRMGTELK